MPFRNLSSSGPLSLDCLSESTGSPALWAESSVKIHCPGERGRANTVIPGAAAYAGITEDLLREGAAVRAWENPKNDP